MFRKAFLANLNQTLTIKDQLMRIISILMVLLALFLALTHVALAEETRTDETNINLTQIFAYDSSVSILNNYILEAEKEKPADPRDIVLAKRWKNKQAHLWDNLPKGQFKINASAYTAAADECGKSDGITASGLKVQEKRTVACPREFPFGAKIKIDGYGTYVCEDRGGAIKGNKIDIYVETKGEAFAFGRRNLTAEVVLN